MEDKLNFPIIRQTLPGPTRLSLKGYLDFVRMHARYFAKRDAIRALREKRAVWVPFKLGP